MLPSPFVDFRAFPLRSITFLFSSLAMAAVLPRCASSSQTPSLVATSPIHMVWPVWVVHPLSCFFSLTLLWDNLLPDFVWILLAVCLLYRVEYGLQKGGKIYSYEPNRVLSFSFKVALSAACRLFPNLISSRIPVLFFGLLSPRTHV